MDWLYPATNLDLKKGLKGKTDKSTSKIQQVKKAMLQDWKASQNMNSKLVMPVGHNHDAVISIKLYVTKCYLREFPFFCIVALSLPALSSMYAMSP